MARNRRTAAIVGLIALALAGCGGADSDSTTSSPEAPVATDDTIGADDLAGYAFEVRRDPG